MRRRHLLQTGAAALVASLAGCPGGDGADTPESTPTDTPDEPATESPTPSPTPTETATETPTVTAVGSPDETSTATSTPDGTPTSTGTPTLTGTPTPTGTPTATETPALSPTPDVAQVVSVAADGEFRFDPDDFEIATGDTVRWTWAAGGHNVRATSTPSGSDWAGTPGGDGETYGSDYTYEYTFDVAGEYDYVCIPHESLGMTGSFTVTE